MGKYVQGPDGKFAGSIGDGKSSVPTPSDIPLNGIADLADVEDFEPTPDEIWNAYKNRHTLERVADEAFLDPLEAVNRVRLNHGVALSEEANDEWVIEREEMADGSVRYRSTTRDGLITYESSDMTDGNGTLLCDIPANVTINAPEGSPAPTVTHIRTDTHGRPHTLGASLPAVESSLGIKYYRHGQLHREDGPAEISENFRAWYRNNVLIGTLDDATGTFHDGNGKKASGLRLWALKRNLPGWDKPNEFDEDRYFGA